MQSLKITQDLILPENTALFLQLYTPSIPSGSTGASGSFDDVEWTRINDYTLVMNGDFNIVANDFYEPTMSMRLYYTPNSWSESTYYAKGNAVELSPNNFELQ